ncbi:MAG TPA: hypothetical protein VFW33_19565 [Gemmataceae bacterium]|nr:hypothetical protein [Gemmataceae bacterium]
MAEIFSDLVVQFSPAGLEVVQSAMGKVAASAGATAQFVTGASAGMSQAAAQWGASWQATAASVAGAAQKGFGAAGAAAGKAAKDVEGAAGGMQSAAEHWRESWKQAAELMAEQVRRAAEKAAGSATKAGQSGAAAAKVVSAAFAGTHLPTAQFDGAAYNKSILVVAEGVKTLGERAKLAGSVLAKAFAEPKAPMKEFSEASAYLGPKLTAGLVQAGRAASSLATGFGAAAGALNPLVMGVGGLVIAGVHASAAGQVLGIQLEELSRQIASVFAPTIYAVMNRLADLTRWFRSLTADQQASIRTWSLTAAGIVAVSVVAPKLIAGFAAMRVAVLAFGTAMKIAVAANPWLLLAGVVAGVVVSMYSLGDVTKTFAAIATAVNEPFQTLLGILKDVGTELRELVESVGLIGKEATGLKEDFSPLIEGIKAVGNTPRRTRALVEKTVGAFGGEAMGERAANSVLGRASFATGFLPGIASLVNVLGGRDWLATAKVWQEGKDGKKGDQLLPPLRGFENIDAAYKRISEAAIRATAGKGYKSAAEESRDTLKDIFASIQRLEGRADNLKPAIK